MKIKKPITLVIHHEHDSGATTIVPSGWTGNFHLIIENPEDGDLTYEYSFHSREWLILNIKDPLLDKFLNAVDENYL